MCTTCQNELASLRSRTGTPAWKINRQHFTDRLQEILTDPDSIQQGALGLCGIAAFLRAWVLRDHLAVVRFAVDLYEHGSSAINDYEVNPSADLLNIDFAEIDWKGNMCPSAEWMIMSALQDEENVFDDFEGTPDSSAGLAYWEVDNYFVATELYDEVDDDNSLIPANFLTTTNLEHAMTLQPSADATDIVLMIHAQMIPRGGSGEWYEIIDNNISNHFIGLCEPITRFSDTEVKMKYFSWGEVSEAIIPDQKFTDNYYGATIAKAKRGPTPLPFTIPAVPGVPTGFSASVRGSVITLKWTSTTLNDKSYVLERRKGGDFSDPVTYFPKFPRAPQPSSLGVSYADDRSAEPDQIYHYRVRAVNANDESAFTNFISVNLATGDIKTVTDATLLRGPCYVRQVAVVRALADLEPRGFALLESGDCICEEPQTVYDATWSWKNPEQRAWNVSRDIPFKPNREAYVFVRFAEHNGVSTTAMNQAMMTATIVDSTRRVAIPLTLRPSADRTYFWSSFTPGEFDGVPNARLTLEISAQDTLDRVVEMSPTGRVIDANPASTARAELGSTLHFIRYEPGTDKNHKVQFSSVQQSLQPDPAETNDSFRTATSASLITSNLFERKRLNLGNSTDTDHFFIQFQATDEDEACDYFEPKTIVLSRTLGLSMILHPPELGVLITTEDMECVDLALHNSEPLGLTQLRRLPRTHEIHVPNPAKDGFTDNRAYLVVSNSDFAAQGAFRYDLKVAYKSFYVQGHVDFSASVYKPRAEIGRKLLGRLYDVIDLPRPGTLQSLEYKAGASALVQRASEFLLNTKTKKDLQAILKKDANALIAKDYHSLGQAAAGLGLKKEAEKLLTLGIEEFAKGKDAKTRVKVLKDLQKFYLTEGLKAKAEKIAVQLKRQK